MRRERLFIGHSLASGLGQGGIGRATRWLLMGVVIASFIAVGQMRTANPIYGCNSISSLTSLQSAVTFPTEVETQISFVGRTSPNALIGVFFEGALIEVGVAGRTGDFRLDIPSNDTMVPGLFSTLTEDAQADESPTFTLFAQDSLRLQSARVTVQPTLTPGLAAEIDLLVMPPTFKVFTSSVPIDGGIALAGSGAPATNIVVVVDGKETGDVVQTGLDGFWTFWLPGRWETGEHAVHVLNRDAHGRVSQPSTPDRFEVIG